jgi:hypothetical protein
LKEAVARERGLDPAQHLGNDEVEFAVVVSNPWIGSIAMPRRDVTDGTS